MRARCVVSGFGLAVVAALAMGGCSSGPGAGGTGGAAAGTSGTAGRGGSAGGTAGTGGVAGTSGATGTGGAAGAGGGAGRGGSAGGTGGTAGTGGSGTCTPRYTVEAKQTPAAIMLVVDRSASITASHWSSLGVGMSTALDNSLFDDLSVGFLAYPQAYTDPPMCLCDSLGVDLATCRAQLAPGSACGVVGTPDVPIGNVGRSPALAASGVRHDIQQWMQVTHSRLSTTDDGAPVYAAMAAGYDALKAAAPTRRMLLLATDGGFSCTAVSSPARPGYSNATTCADWEQPDSVNALIASRRTDPTAPVETVVIGLVGSHSTGQMQGSFATPPYAMALALSTYAVSGSPTSVDAACAKTATFTMAGAAPAMPCHIDLAGTSTPTATAIADATRLARRRALGCVYDVPALPNGETFDAAQTRVTLTTDGTVRSVRRRTTPTDTCATDGCWDVDTAGHVTVLGMSCDRFCNSAKATISLAGGCPAN